eukprot:767416-Hanusia_phi.AAC.2
MITVPTVPFTCPCAEERADIDAPYLLLEPCLHEAGCWSLRICRLVAFHAGSPPAHSCQETWGEREREEVSALGGQRVAAPALTCRHHGACGWNEAESMPVPPVSLAPTQQQSEHLKDSAKN